MDSPLTSDIKEISTKAAVGEGAVSDTQVGILGNRCITFLKKGANFIISADLKTIAKMLIITSAAELMIVLLVVLVRTNLLSPSPETAWSNVVLLFISIIALIASLFLAWSLHCETD